MTDTPYNKRELDHFLGDMKEQLDRIEKQVKLTNGRTTTNELNISTVNTKINTAIWAFGITFPIILALAAAVLYAKIETAVYQALDTYQFEVIDPMIK